MKWKSQSKSTVVISKISSIFQMPTKNTVFSGMLQGLILCHYLTVTLILLLKSFPPVFLPSSLTFPLTSYFVCHERDGIEESNLL